MLLRPICKFLPLLFVVISLRSQAQWIIEAPAADRITAIHPQGETVIPNGRLITPKGKTFTVAPHPYGLALSLDGSIAVTANCGIRPLSVSILTNLQSQSPSIDQIPDGTATDQGVLAAVYMGLAISPDNNILYVAGGQEGKIYLFDLPQRYKIAEIECNTTINGRAFSSSYIGDMAISKDGKRLYAVDQLNFRMLVLDLENSTVLQSIAVGRYPFGITLSADESKAYVANVGMYEYKIAYTYKPALATETRIHKDVFPYLSEESVQGSVSEGVEVPGLGDPLSPEAFSVFTIDLRKNEVISKVKTGIQIGQPVEGVPAVGGSSPNSLAATDKYVFVSNGNNDCITVMDAQNHTVLKQIFLNSEPRLKNLRGMIPFGLALSPDSKRLYVAEAGINAVGVIDVASLSVIGHIPTAWFPSKLKVSPDGKKLIVACAKGFGSGPNGGPGFEIGPEGSYIGNLMKGVVNIIDIPSVAQLKEDTKKVISNNYSFSLPKDPKFSARNNNPIPLFPGQKQSPIQHVVFVLKENRTYDEVLGQIPGGNGIPEMARFGAGVKVNGNDYAQPIEGATIAPNHLSLARRFAISDNFYVDADVSADGHKWLVGVYPNEWVEVNVVNAYGGARGFRNDTVPPGAELLLNSYVSPEDYNEGGSVWFHLERNKVPFFNFGLDTYILPRAARAAFSPTANRMVTNRPAPKALMENTSQLYPTYNTSIPDQFRIDMFIEEFDNRWINGTETMPAYMTVRLGNDHGAGVRPEGGYPYFQSYMADNDLALGRLVEYLSHTKYWENMLIVVTEDDAQGGVDHIDAHRSILMAISPYAKPGFISHTHASFGSIMKTFWNLLGIPYINQYDAGATDLYHLFTDTPDLRPYKALPCDPEIFDPAKALDPFDRDFDWSSLDLSPEMDNVNIMQKMSDQADIERALYQPLPPEIKASGSKFHDNISVILASRITDLPIYYTLDGSEPTNASSLYQAPISLSQSTTLKAKVFNPKGLSSRSSVKNFSKLPLNPGVAVSNLVPGLTFQMAEGLWDQIPTWGVVTIKNAGTVQDLTPTPAPTDKEGYAVRFETYINITSNAVYTFHLTSDDGSALFIDHEKVVDNDGKHRERTRSGEIALARGWHLFHVDYFQNGQDKVLKLEIQPQGGARRTLSPADFFYKKN